MLTRLEARNILGSILHLPLDDVSGGYSVEDIGGLGPVKATVVSSSYADQDGAQFQNIRRETRNITIQLGIEADYALTTVGDLRLGLYDFFMPKSEVNLTFYDSSRAPVAISGWVETCEPAIFSDKPAVDVSIMCLDSDFVELTPNELSWNTSDNTDDEDGKLHILYTGNIETGIQLTLNLNRSLTEFTIYHHKPDNTITSTDIQAPLSSGDVFTLNTVVGSKRLTLLKSGVTSSLLYAKSPQSGWIELVKGDNYIRVYTAGAAIPYTVTYTTRHGGL